MYNIVTCICVDQDKSGENVKYPNIGGEKNKKHVYWRCGYTFCAALVKINPDKKHILVTNDLEEIIIDNINVKKELAALGVKIIYLDFNRFDPGKHSIFFRNAFYKLQVVERLAQEALPSLLLDSDILWHKKDVVLDEIMSSGEYLVVQDTYQRSSTPLSKIPHNISMKDMGDLYHLVGIQGYNQPYPIWYGGELIGGSPETLGKVAKNILELLNYCKQEDNKGNKFLFPNGNSIFDNDEYIASYVYNSLDVKVYDTYNRHIKRLWTGEIYNNVEEGDEKISIWHLLNEKGTGLKQLFYESVNPDSDFWTCTDFTAYLGKYVGIPKRKLVEKSTTGKSKVLIYNQLRYFNSIRKRLKWWYHMRLKKRK